MGQSADPGDMATEINRLNGLIDDLRNRLKVQQRECVRAALNAKLPKGFQWGRDAMEQFNFGKQRAAEAIKSLKFDSLKENEDE